MRWFSKFSGAVSDLAGRPLTFVIAVGTIAAWSISGPIFHFSDTWQLVINTTTTIITFLMVFLIQNTQNRESKAMQLKLDELIRSIDGAHNALLNLEELTTDEIAYVHEHYKRIAHSARMALKNGEVDTGTPAALVAGMPHSEEFGSTGGDTIFSASPETVSPSDVADEAITEHDKKDAA